MVVHNHLLWDLMPSAGIRLYMQIEHSYIKEIHLKKKKRTAGVKDEGPRAGNLVSEM